MEMSFRCSLKTEKGSNFDLKPERTCLVLFMCRECTQELN